MIVDPVQALAKATATAPSLLPSNTILPGEVEYQYANDTGKRTLW